MAKIAVTLVWAGVLIAANKALDEVTWAQYVVTFLLGGMYAFTVSKMPGARSERAHEGSER